MGDLSGFYQKNGLTVRNIARDLLCLSEGEIMTPIAEYTEILQVSRWTIQTAIQYLLENKCMAVEKHGPNGTNVYNLNHKKLWELAELNPFIGMAAPSYTVIHESLYTGISETIKPKNIPFVLGYMVPAGVRVEALLGGRCHFVVMSELSARLLMKKNKDIVVPLKIPGAYYAMPFKIFAAKGKKPEIKDGTVVGVPKDSIDVAYITKMICRGKKVKYKYSNYHGCSNMLEKGEIDVLIQREDVNVYYNRDYASKDIKELGLEEEIVTPVLVCDCRNYGVDKVVKKFINPSEIAKIQNEVLEGKRLYNFY